ncbi:MAG: DNA polymerase III subunit delta, partial [Planctomycetia bacterium]|nr:DNA polymerase III subunit delta [Planctomycetia bacterium]
MAAPLTALDYLTQVAAHPAAPVCVVFGDEPYLKRRVVAALRNSVLTTDDAELSLCRADGSGTLLRDVIDELSTVSMFGGGRRLVIVEDADEFVTRFRADLEDYVNRPVSSGILTLVVSTWAATTRLYKAVAETGLQIDCKTPAKAAVVKWLGAAAKEHNSKLAPGAADQLLEMVGLELG